ncbi:hypothetical protein BEN78_02915 [Xanthomonas citri pv. mangiferaeindicae]|nr:hypothetical protein BEN78_02915 [Xanthomonas citri pv. mangiferaeindicae]
MGRVGQRELGGRGSAVADQHADTATGIDRGKAGLVGQIVACEHRTAAGERRLLQEREDRTALVGMLGAQFDDMVAGLELVAGQPRQHGLGERAQCDLGLRRAAPVQAERRALVFDHGPGIPTCDHHGLVADRGQCGRRRRAVADAIGTAPLDAVQAGGGEPFGCEQPVERRQAASADQRQCTAQ